MIELDRMDNEISLYLNWNIEFDQPKLKDLHLPSLYPPLLYYDKHNSAFGGGSLWFNFPQKIKGYTYDEVWVSRDIEKIFPPNIDEIRFWINANRPADGTEKHPHYLFFTLDTFRQRNIYWSIPISTPGDWELKRFTVRGEMEERILGRKMHSTKLDKPERASKVYFRLLRPRDYPGDIRFNLDYLAAIPTKDSKALPNVADALEKFLREIEKDLQLRFDVIPDPTPQDLNRPIKNLTVRLHPAGVNQNWPRGNYHRQKSNYIYRMDNQKKPELISFATRPPACPHDVIYYIEVLSPQEKDKPKEALQIRNRILQKIASEPYLWIHGEKVPLSLMGQEAKEDQFRVEDLEDPNALQIRISTKIETGDWEFHVMDRLQVDLVAKDSLDPAVEERESLFDLSFVLRLQGYSQIQAREVVRHLESSPALEGAKLIEPITSPPLIRLYYPSTGDSQQLLEDLRQHFLGIESSLRPKKVDLSKKYHMEIVEVEK